MPQADELHHERCNKANWADVSTLVVPIKLWRPFLIR